MASITIYICPVGSGDHDLYFLIKLLCLSFIESCVVTVKGFQLFKSYQYNGPSKEAPFEIQIANVP